MSCECECSGTAPSSLQPSTEPPSLRRSLSTNISNSPSLPSEPLFHPHARESRSIDQSATESRSIEQFATESQSIDQSAAESRQEPRQQSQPQQAEDRRQHKGVGTQLRQLRTNGDDQHHVNGTQQQRSDDQVCAQQPRRRRRRHTDSSHRVVTPTKDEVAHDQLRQAQLLRAANTPDSLPPVAAAPGLDVRSDVCLHPS